MKTLSQFLSTLIVLACPLTSFAANRTWDGGDLDLPTFWSARTNWNGNTNIAAGDALFFPGTAAVKTMDNNLSISNFAKLTFNDDGYTLNGNSLRLTNGIKANYTPTGPTRINVGITLGDDSAFEADDSSATLELNGPVNLLGFVLTNQGVGTVTWLAPFSSTAGGLVRKREIGTTIVRSTNANFLGTVEVSGGDFVVNGRMTAGAIAVNSGGTLAGTGLVHAVTVNNSGVIAPAGAGRGVLTVTNGLTLLPRSIFEADILGSTAGTFDQLNVLGRVSLTNAALNLTVNFIPASPTAITIIANDGVEAVLGTFSGLPQGATVLVTNSVRATISYTGGTGNDVVILVTPVATLTWTGLGANNLWSTPQNWAGNFAPAPGDRLVFPPAADRRTNQNDFPAGMIFGSLEVRGSYQLDGAAIGLHSGVFAVGETPRWNMNVPVTLLGSQTFSLSNNFNFGMVWDGPIQLGAHTLTLAALGPNPMLLRGVISGPGQIRKTGPDIIAFDGDNSYTGLTRVEEGFLEVRNRFSLGLTNSGTVVSNGAVLTLNSLNNSELADPVTLAGRLHFLEDAFASAPLTVSGNASIRAITDRDVTFFQPIFGDATLTIESLSALGDGPTYHLAAANPMSGVIQALGVTIDVDGSIPNAPLVLGVDIANQVVSKLTGTGLVRALSVGANCILSPAGLSGGDGTISTLVVTQSLVMHASSIYRVNLNGLNVQNYDQLDVLGTVNLGAGVANLDVQFGFTPPEGHTFIILDNDGADAITGTFAGKAQGAIFTTGGQRLQISYTGGTGNDIALTVLGPEEMTWTGAVNGFWSTSGNWSPARAPQDGDRLIFPGGTPRRFNTNNLGGLDLHSLRYPGTGTSNNTFFVRGNGFTLGSGLVVTNPASVEFQMPVAMTTPQSLVVHGLVTFDSSLALNGDVTAIGNGSGSLRVKNVSGTGRLSLNGAALTITGTNSHSGGLALLNTLANYGAVQSAGAPALVTNSTFRYSGGASSVRGLLLDNSVLDTTQASVVGPENNTLRVEGDLIFLGASRFQFDFDTQPRPVVEVTGDVRLNNATLTLSNIIAAFNVPLTMIRNLGPNPVVGTFSGLPEGAVVVGPNALQLRVSYVGGDGNDVTLTPLAPVTGFTRIWSGLGPTRNWSEPANWQGLQAPLDGDSLEFPNAPQPINTNNLPANLVNQLRFTSPVPLNRVLATGPGGGFTALRLVGGLDFRETGTLRIPVTNSGFLTLNGFVQSEAPQTFFVTNGGRVSIQGLGGLPGAAVTKTGEGELEINAVLSVFNFGVPLHQSAGTLRVGETLDLIEQSGGVLEILKQGGDVTLFGGAFQTAPIVTNLGVSLQRLDASGTTNPVVIRPGGEGVVGLLTVTNGVTLNSNVTLRMEVGHMINVFGFILATNDLIDLGDTGDFRIDGARLELNFLPAFNPHPTNLVLLGLSQNARTNLGHFAGLPQLGLLTNEFGVFRIFYRDIPPFINLFNPGTNHSSVLLERVMARPVMVTVTNGPGAFKTVLALGTPGALYVVEGSEDFVTWTALSGETANATTGRISFTDVSGLPYRFYRARLP